MARSIFFLMVVVLSAVCGAVARQSIELHVFTEEYPPFSYTAQGKIIGIHTELILQMLDDVGASGRFGIVPWGRAQRFTQTEPNTCFFSAVRTEEREAMYQWVGPLSREYVQLYSMDPDHVKFPDLSAAKHLRIGGQTADAYTDYGERQGLNIERIAEAGINLSMLELKRNDLWLAGSIAGPFIASKNGLQLYPVASSDDFFELWMACHPEVSSPFIDALNSTLQRMQSDGTHDRILKRYR